MENPRLALVTQWFPPEIEGVPLWVAEALQGEGLNIGVVTGMPHYPEGVLHTGYSAWTPRSERIAGFRALRVPEYPSHDNSSLRRIATFGSFAAAGSVFASRAIGAADAALVYSSPATAALPAMVARVRRGVPYVLFVQDLWPDSIFATGFLQSGFQQALVRHSVGRITDATYRYASRICVITPGMRDILIERGVPEPKVSVVFNWVDEDVLSPGQPGGELRRALHLSQSAFIALYAGNAGEAQGLDSWIEAFGLLEDRPDCHLVLMGGGTRRSALEASATARGLSGRVHFLAPVPVGRVPDLVADADVSVVSLADRKLFEITLPSKVQATLAMASPVVASCAGDAADVVNRSGAGWVASPEDPQTIAQAIRAALAAGTEQRRLRGLAGRRFYERYMAREIGAARLSSAIREAIDDNPRRRRAVARRPGQCSH